MTVEQVLKRLTEMADPEAVIRKEKKFGVVAHEALGIYQKQLNELVQQLPKDNALAVQLFDSGIYEARILCSKMFRPKDLTSELMEKWVVTFENWEICDSFCMALFAKSKWAVPKALEWAEREAEFERRAAFATIAAYCMADKKADNKVFESFFPLIEKHATDNRLYVKKAVNWALRNIGKRNRDLNKAAKECAKRIQQLDTPTSRWIASDALKELEKENVRMSDYPRSIYRPV